MSAAPPAPATSEAPASTPPIGRLLAIMARLRDPDRGCEWDREQSFATIAPYTIEEAYEVADAIERNDLPDLKDELGDLLLQVVFHARMAEEQDAFGFDDVVRAICDKMVRRHPHVFGEVRYGSAAAQTEAWETLKAAERADKGRAHSLLDDVPVGLPALTRALKLSKRAARVGFVWPTTAAVMDKLREELAELDAEIEAGDREKAEEELGDLLFVCANVARSLEIDPETALRAANAKFIRRFGAVERALAAHGRTPQEASLAEMEDLWTAAKAEEKAAGGA